MNNRDFENDGENCIAQRLCARHERGPLGSGNQQFLTMLTLWKSCKSETIRMWHLSSADWLEQGHRFRESAPVRGGHLTLPTTGRTQHHKQR